MGFIYLFDWEDMMTRIDALKISTHKEAVMFMDQKSYEEYHSRDQASKRQHEYEDARNKVIAAAQALYDAGDREGAAIMLFNAGIDSTAVGS